MEKTLILKKEKAPATRVVRAVSLKPCDFVMVPGQNGAEDHYIRQCVYVSPTFQQVSVECTSAVFDAVQRSKLDMLVGYHYYIHYNASNQVCRVEPVKVKDFSFKMLPEEEQAIKQVELLVEPSGFTSVKSFPPNFDSGDLDRIKRAVDAAVEIYEGDKFSGYPILSYTKGTDGVTLTLAGKSS